jgi:hypothetical protein
MTERFHTFIGMVDYGGPGSGNFGHAGRPGKVGGSAGKSSAGSGSKSGNATTSDDPLRGKTTKKKTFGISSIDHEAVEKIKGELNKYLPSVSLYVVGEGGDSDKQGVMQARALVSVTKDISQRYPNGGIILKSEGMAEGLRSVMIRPVVRVNDKNSPEVFGVYSGRDKWIQLSGRNALSKQAPPTLGADKVGGGFKDTFRHELGHAVHKSIPVKSKEKWSIIYSSLESRMYGTYVMRDRVSTYAATNIKEGFAESFSAYTNPMYGKNQRRLPKPVEDYFKDLLGA